MKHKLNIKLISTIEIFIIILLVIGTSYAFFEATVSSAAIESISIYAHTVDTLTFSISNNLSIETNQDTFKNGDGNISDESTATAVLTPNSKTGTATKHYYLSFYLSSNNTVYSSANTNQDPEYMLQIFDSNNQLVTLTGLGTQKTIKGVTGYDITGKTGIYTILDNYEITASNNQTAIQTWRVIVTAINLDVKQNENAGTKIDGKLLVNETGFNYCAVNPENCVSLTVANLPQTEGKTLIPSASCTGATAVWNNTYNQLEVTSINSERLNCSLTYAEANNKTLLNQYIQGLEGTNQGTGKVVEENGSVPDYSDTTIIKQYATTPIYFQNTASTSIDQTNVDNYWTFDSNTGEFTSDPTKFTVSGNSNMYHVYAQIPEEGYYKICYSMDRSDNSNNNLTIAKNNNVSYATVFSSTSAQITNNCTELGYFSASDYINISERGYSGTSSTTISFRFEKSNTMTNINTGYRYEGSNPNNYVLYNNELWRIIGVFPTEYDTNNDGAVDTTNNLVKLIRPITIGGYHKNSNSTNWQSTSLYHVLNEIYYDWNANKTNADTYCRGASTTSKKCDFSVTGIKDGYRNMIAKVKWYLGGAESSSYNYTADDMYKYERDSSTVRAGNSFININYIGLMYTSDYMYGTLKSDCEPGNTGRRLVNYNQYNNEECGGKNWLNGQGIEWIITPSKSSAQWYISNNGCVSSNNAFNAAEIRPTLYLLPSVYKLSGTGTITDPYIIGM